MESTSHLEDVSKQKWTLLCNSEGVYILILEAKLSMLLYKRHIFHKGLNAIYIALGVDKSVWAKRAKAETNSRSEKSLATSYHTHSLPVSDSRC